MQGFQCAEYWKCQNTDKPTQIIHDGLECGKPDIKIELVDPDYIIDLRSDDYDDDDDKWIEDMFGDTG